jgi:transcriptional regulator with XRE-family HTH domain
MKLKTYMQRKSLKDADVASALGVDEKTVKNWLTGASLPQKRLQPAICAWSGGAVQIRDFLA